MLDRLGLFEYRVVLHVHSRYSDGTGTVDEIVADARRAGVDVLWLTDHDTRRAVDNPGPGYYGHLLMLVGAEVTPPTNHCLVLGEVDLPSPQDPLQTVIDRVRDQGGLTFIAHPDDPGSPTARLPSYRWDDRTADGFTGLEVWNHLSDWSRTVRNIPTGIWAAWHPFRRLAAHPDTLALWDALGQQRRVVGLGGVDVHAAHVGVWPARLTIFPYRTAFRGIRTHVYTPEPLPQDWHLAQAMLMEAIGRGRVAVVNARVGEELGFRLWAEHSSAAPAALGDELDWAQGYRLKGLSPVPARWEIWQNGARVGEQEGTLLEWPVTAAGVWRVVLRRGKGSDVWIYSNALYFR